MNATPTPSITTWTRLEPRPRGGTLTPSLEASIFDPAWMLARQWQLAEFRGQDAAFPVQVSFTVNAQPLAATQPPEGHTAGPAGQYPLEATVWPEPPTTLTSGASAEFGAELVRLLTEQGCSPASISSIIGNYPLAEPPPGAADPQGMAFLALLAGRLPDATQVEPLMREAAGGTVPGSLGVASDDETAVINAAKDWVAELDSFALSTPQPADTWQPSRLEHQFSVTAGSPSGAPFSLATASWPGRLLEWSDFDIPAQANVPPPATLPALPEPDSATGTVADPATGTVSGTGPPHPLTYPGAPNRRYWTFEDGNFNLATVTVSPDDLARMLIVEFASVYANDWYMLPIQLPYGALHRIDQLTITNSFDETENLDPVALSIPAFGSAPAGTPDWCLFRNTVTEPDGSTANLNGLLLLPGAAAVQASPPVEEVVLIRDDTADLGWAVEHTVLGADDRPLDRYSAAAQQTPLATTPPPADDGSAVRYLLETDVPVYCFPLVPDPSGQPELDLLVLQRVGTDGQPHDVLPQGQLLPQLLPPPQPPQSLFDQELPAEGTTIRRRRYLIRGYDGEPLLWTGRERTTGGHYGSIPLAFDQITAPAAATQGGT
jgi:hypothetical protein